MNTVAVISYTAAAGLFLVLGALLVTSWRGRMQGGLLVTACFVSAAWAGLIAVASSGVQVPLQVLAVSEFVRDAARTALAGGRNPVVVVRPSLRRVLALPLLDEKPRISVISYNEIVGVKNIEPVAVVRLPEEVHEVMV